MWLHHLGQLGQWAKCMSQLLWTSMEQEIYMPERGSSQESIQDMDQTHTRLFRGEFIRWPTIDYCSDFRWNHRQVQNLGIQLVLHYIHISIVLTQQPVIKK